MTLDEAIRHETEVAEKYTEDAMMLEDRYALTRESCLRCAKDRRQIAEWLMELKERRAKDKPQIDGAIDEARFKVHCMNCQRDNADIKCLDCDGDKYYLPDES